MQQTMSPPNLHSNKNGNSQPQKIIITAITLFALAGLLVGFTFGAINHPNKAAPVTQTLNPSPVAGRTVTAQPTATIDVLKRGTNCPPVHDFSADEKPDGTSNYT